MKKKLLNTSTCLFLLFFSFQALAESPQVVSWNNELNSLDIQYQRLKSQPGGITPAQERHILNRKGDIVGQAGFTSFKDFSTFQGTRVQFVQSETPTFLVRRGYGEENLSKYGMGRWFGDTYNSVNGTRNNLAVLDTWGNPLESIYVIKVPANQVLLGGIAAAQISSDGKEYRPGGGLQYWFQNNGLQTNEWLLYAVYGPDHLKSYATNVTTAQQLGRSVMYDTQLRLEDIRSAHLFTSGVQEENDSTEHVDTYTVWSRAYGLNVSGFDANDETYYQTHGTGVGLDKEFKIKNGVLSVGGVTGYAEINKTVDTSERNFTGYSDINNIVRNIQGAAYLLYQQNYKGYGKPHFYADATVMGGLLKFINEVPGYSGLGYRQDYDGGNFLTSLEVGFTLPLNQGVVIEPEITFDYNKIMHEDFQDKILAPVTLESGISLRTGAGVKIKKNFLEVKQVELSTVLIARYEREFSGDNEIWVMDESASDNQKGDFFTLGGGAKINIVKRLFLRAEILRLLGNEEGYRGYCTLNFLF
ncbi:MAG: autotransporter outer membrane beta-barrel domain-containing protein [Proteobacteria bacterium]|nr:autotransporter outer membrane beta-barrel domain-containing protein [Pseudomonadota bacterium]MBU1058447.1 autotransporter outer membrane beta-barrel domain-containing protein [Pseudomonadota bacterium]